MAIKIVVIGFAAAFAPALFWFYAIPKAVVAVNSDLDDPCGTISKIWGENIDLHIRPSNFSQRIKELPFGTTVNVCIEDGGWSGVIVSYSGDCEITDNISSSGEYMGTCQAGWIKSNLLQLVAG